MVLEQSASWSLFGAVSSTYLRFGLEVLGSGIWGVQKTQRDTLATLVLIVFKSDDF